MSLNRGPYKSKPPASSPRAYRGRALVCEPKDESPASEEPEQNFVTALVKAFVRDKLTPRQGLRRKRKKG